MGKISKEVEFPYWDREEDVVIVGYGYAGAASAISAHDAGAKTLILEKMANPGGCSVLSGGHMIITDDVEAAITYLRHTQGGRCGEDLIKAMAQGLHDLPAYIEELGSFYGHLYLLGGNISESIIGGRIAGKMAAYEEP